MSDHFELSYPDITHAAPVFAPAEFRTCHFKQEALTGYHVYKTPTEFIRVEAESAADALEKGGIADPLKIIRADNEAMLVVDKDVLEADSISTTENPPSQVS